MGASIKHTSIKHTSIERTAPLAWKGERHV